MPLSRTNLGFLCWPRGRRSAGLLRSRHTPDEGIADEARCDGYRVFGEAKPEVLLVPETLQPPCRAVVLQRPHGARQVSVEDTPGPPVQFSTPRAKPVEDGPACGLVLGGAPTLPAAPDYNHLCAVVGRAGQLLGNDAGVDESSCQDGPRATGGLHDAGPVRGREGDRGARRHL